MLSAAHSVVVLVCQSTLLCSYMLVSIIVCPAVIPAPVYNSSLPGYQAVTLLAKYSLSLLH